MKKQNTKFIPQVMVSSILVLSTANALTFDNLSLTRNNEITDFRYTEECTTKGTKWPYERDTCHSGLTEVTLPKGFVFNKDSLSVRMTTKRGSKNRCDVNWSDYIELIPGTGLRAPRTISVRAYAESPKYKHGARGVSKCEFTGKYTKIR